MKSGLLLLIAFLPSLSTAEMATVRLGSPPAGAPAAAAASKQAKPPTGYVAETARPPTIDGKLTDPAWAKAAPLLLSRTLDGAGRAPEPTEVRCLHDGKTLYIAVRCAEPLMKKLRASRRSHDGEIWGDDSVEIFLGAGRTYYHFGVNALGSTYDGKLKDPSWNSDLQAAADRGEREWTVELAIPLEKLTGKGKPPEEWTANFNRNRYTAGSWQELAWSPTYSGDSHAPDRFGRLLFKDPPAKPTGDEQPVVKKGLQILRTADERVVLRFDLSALPKGAKIHRADLRVFRTTQVDGRYDEAMVDVEVYALSSEFKAGERLVPAGAPLEIRGPWYDCLDATAAVRRWASGKPNGGFYVKACPFLKAEDTCLDIAYEGKPGKAPPQVTGVKAFHRAGQTFLTWKEIDDPVATDEIRWGQFKRILDNLDQERRVRYCVYRSAKPITAGNLHEAERIATVKPLSCWNVNGRNVDKPIDDMLGNQYFLAHHQWNPFVGAGVDGKYGLDCLMERLVIRNAEKPLPRTTGLYVHTRPPPGGQPSDKKSQAYYAVVTCVDGVQNTAEISAANSLAEAVEEVEGRGEPVRQKVFPPKPYFNYEERRFHFVRWVAPPYCNLPSQYYNWSVAWPEKLCGAVDKFLREEAAAEEGSTPTALPKSPVELSLHRDGRSYYRTQYRVEGDTIVLSPHDFPVSTWWYGYHESLGTLKSFRQGKIHNYTERRLLAFIDWLADTLPIDRSRILVTGCAGGAAGSGALHLGVRHPEVFSLVLSGYGMADYAGEIDALMRVKRAGAMPAQMESIWGQVKWGLKTDTGKNVWDELNLTKTVTELPDKTDLPLVTVTGRGMLKPMRDFYVAMLDKGQPFMCRYGVYGGGTLLPVSRTGTWSRMIRLDVRKDQPMPAFRGPGASGLFQQPKEPAGNLVVSDGVRYYWGEIGTGFRWKSEDLVETPNRLEISLFWAGSSRERKPHADVTIRRVQQFRLRPEWEYSFELRNPAGEVVEQGKIKPGKKGLLTFYGVHIPAEGVRLIIKP